MVNKEDGDGGGDRQLFADLSYRLLGFDDCPDLERQYKEAIEKRGGKYALRLNKESWTHLIIYSERIDYNDKFCMMARKLDITVVNEIWVDDSLSLGGLANPKRVLYWPVKELAGISGCLQLRISVYGYPLARSIEIQRMIHLMGATFCEECTEKGTHLICYEFEGPVYNLAKKCKANVVNDKWLEDCLKEWKIVPIANYNTTSGSELELIETQSKGVNKQLVFKAKTPGRQYHTPESKLSSTDMTRKAFSVGTKRSNLHMDYENTVKCKRALHFGSTSSGSEITMYEYATHRLTKKITIPYMLNKIKVGKEAAKLILLNAYGLVIDLHSEGKTLKGLFSSINFLISLRTKKVTLRGIEPQGYAKGDCTLDKTKFVAMVKGMFGDDLPDDIKIWLDCIEKGGHDNVVRKHINMLHANNIFGEFCLMYHSLLEMKELAEDKFETLLKTLYTYEGWESRMFNWRVLESNRRYQDRNADNKTGSADSKIGPHHKAGAFGLMHQLRNCWEHPARRYKRFLLAVLLDEFPELLSDIQQALYDAGYLPQLDIENLDQLDTEDLD